MKSDFVPATNVSELLERFFCTQLASPSNMTTSSDMSLTPFLLVVVVVIGGEGRGRGGVVIFLRTLITNIQK